MKNVEKLTAIINQDKASQRAWSFIKTAYKFRNLPETAGKNASGARIRRGDK